MMHAHFARTKKNKLPAHDHQDGRNGKIINRIAQFCGVHLSPKTPQNREYSRLCAEGIIQLSVLTAVV